MTRSIDKTVQVLIIEHDEATATALTAFLSRYGCEVEHARSIEEAAELMGADSPDVLLLDARLPGPDVSHFIAWLSDEPDLSDLPVLLIEPASADMTRDEARRMGARDIIQRPFYPAKLIRQVAAAATSRMLERTPPVHLRHRTVSVSSRGDWSGV